MIFAYIAILLVAAIVAAKLLPKLAVAHFGLILGALVFAFPLGWQVLTSLKEDDDIGKEGSMWKAPRLKVTQDYYPSADKHFITNYKGQQVEVTLTKLQESSKTVVEVVHPMSLRGQTFVPASELTETPIKARVVEGSYKGQHFTGFIKKENDDGTRTIQVNSPTEIQGQSITQKESEITDVYKGGLKWSNYPEALEFLPEESHYGLTYFRNTLFLVFMNLVGTLLSSTLVAYGFSRIRFPGRELLFKLLLATLMLPGAVTMLPKFLIYRNLGWIDTLNPLWVGSFLGSAFNIFLLRQFFLGIPTELEDACEIDGCTPLRTLTSVMLPQVKPALAAVAVWTFTGTWNDFMGPLVYINSPELMPISYGLQRYLGEKSGEPALLMAFSTLCIIPVIAVFAAAQKYFVEGVSLTGMGGR